VDALPLCGLNEAAVNMLIGIETVGGHIDLDTNNIFGIGKDPENEGNLLIKTNLVKFVRHRAIFQEEYDEYEYYSYSVTPDSYAAIRGILKEAGFFLGG